jgi:hypothetical protein
MGVTENQSYGPQAGYPPQSGSSGYQPQSGSGGGSQAGYGVGYGMNPLYALTQYGQPVYCAPLQPEAAAPKPKSRKRKADTEASGSTKQHASGKEVIDLTDDAPKKPKRPKRDPNEEKRLKRWRKAAPQSYNEIKERALSQRMFVLDRQRDISDPDHPTETISLAGTTGNVYTITIDKVPSCDCPHANKGNQCKHIVYVLCRVLRVSGGLEYQLAFVSAELREIFAKAPALPSEQADQTKKDGNRKAIEGECPICCVDFDPDDSSEEVVYCKAACGNNIHKACFDQWAATKKGGIPCPFCRTPWQAEEGDMKNVVKSGTVNGDGYVNVASQLGLSGERDYSTYHQYWVRRHLGYGRYDGD